MKVFLLLGATATAAAAFSSSRIQRSRRPLTQQFAVSRRDAMAAGLATLLVPARAVHAEPRPTYLTEPTDEFKENERKAMEFKREQLALKKSFVEALDKFTKETAGPSAVAKDINAIQDMVARIGGLPAGIKKEEVYKIIRTRKAKGDWPTEVELAYQSLIREILFQQSPNTEKEFGNPYQ